MAVYEEVDVSYEMMLLISQCVVECASMPVWELYNSHQGETHLSQFSVARHSTCSNTDNMIIMDFLKSLTRPRSISEKCTVQVISVLSMVTCLATLITYLILLRDPLAWDSVADYVLHWIVDNNLDVTVRLNITYRETAGIMMKQTPAKI